MKKQVSAKEEASPEQVAFESQLDSMMEEFKNIFPPSMNESSWFDLMHSVWNKHVQPELMEKYSNLYSRSSACSVVEDWQVIHSARYILEDLNHEKGMQALADLSGLPMGVITAAFQNIFPPNVKVDSPDEVGLNPTTCSAGAIPWDFTPEEKEEVINHIRSLGPQYQNSAVILDKSDIPEDLLDQVSFADRDEDEVRNASRQFLSNLRRHREIQNQNPQDHSKSSNSDSEI